VRRGLICGQSVELHLLRIEKEAFSGCDSLSSFFVPRAVEVIGENCFQKCRELESCSIGENAMLARIGKGAFSECNSLRSFAIPKSVEVICDDSFKTCSSLYRRTLVSDESLKKLIGDFLLDEVLAQFGFDAIASLMRIEIGDGGVQVGYPGWSSIADESSHLTLIQGIP
jgi:hypothetical protein